VTCAQGSQLETAYDVSSAHQVRQLRALLAARLERQGVGQAQMAGFFRELAQLIRKLPDATLPAVNARLHYLGWGDVTMDYHSLQLAAACLAER
jgi:hypothetical protein